MSYRTHVVAVRVTSSNGISILLRFQYYRSLCKNLYNFVRLKVYKQLVWAPFHLFKVSLKKKFTYNPYTNVSSVCRRLKIMDKLKSQFKNEVYF